MSNVTPLRRATRLPNRALAMLRAVADGRAEMTCSCEPDLFVDGLACCDQMTAHALAHAGLIQPARPGVVGQRVPVRLTPHGYALVVAPPEAA
jgi:hypothetical protein